MPDYASHPRRPARLVTVSLALALLLAGSGCGFRQPIRVVTPQSQNALSDWVRAVKAGLTEIGASDNINTEAGRNLSLSYSESAVMARYTTVRGKINNSRAASKIIFDIVDLGLTATVPISNGLRGKSILGSLATGFKGSNLSIDKNLFNEQSTPALLSAMDTCVVRQQQVLAAKRALPVSRYTVFDGYGDLTRLFGCTTLAGAVNELSKNQAAAASSLEKEIVLAPITPEQVQQLERIQSAFAESLAGTKVDALALFTELGVQGFNDQSTSAALRAAYRALASTLKDSGKVIEFIAAAKKAKLLTE
jgi:hypothetical protein